MKSTIIVTAALLAVAAPGFAQQGQGQGRGQPGAQFIENWDLSANGHVSRADFLQRRDDIFRMFDADESDTWEGDDLLAVAEHMAADADRAGHGAGGRGPGVIVHQAMTVEFSDTDGDGQISRAEFADASVRAFDMLDRNGDDRLEMADFR